MINVGDDRHPLPGCNHERPATLCCELDAIALENDWVALAASMGMIPPKFQRQRSGAANYVLFLDAVCVHWSDLVLHREHELLAVFRLFGKIHEHKPNLFKPAQAEVGHIPF